MTINLKRCFIAMVSWYNNIKSYLFSVKLFNGLSIICFFIAIVSFLWILCVESWQYEWDLTNKGMEQFIALYGFPIKVFGVYLAIITIIYTIKRSTVTEQQLQTSIAQLEMATEQNRISNTFKFRDEFIKHINASQFSAFCTKTDDFEKTPEEVFYPIYFQLYGAYNNFNINMLESSRNSLDDFYAKNNVSKMNTLNYTELKSIEPQAFEELYETVEFHPFSENIVSIIDYPVEMVMRYLESTKVSIKRNNEDRIALSIKFIFIFTFLEIINSFNNSIPVYSLNKMRQNLYRYIRENTGKRIYTILNEIINNNRNTEL